MKLLQWTFFLDMLGYGNKNSLIKNHEDAQKFIDFMKGNKKILDFQENNEPLKTQYKTQWFDLYKYYEIKFTFISDSLVFTMLPKEVDEDLGESVYYSHSANVLFIISMRIFTVILYVLEKEKIFIRGGISNKFCDINEHFAVGEGLIEAYNLETKFAIYPRILLSKEISSNDKIMNSLKTISKRMYNSNYLVKKDTDGYFYLDYLTFKLSQSDKNSQAIQVALKKRSITGIELNQQESITIQIVNIHKEIIENNINELNQKIIDSDNDKDLEKYNKILQKYIWLKKYHNRVISKFPKYSISKISI
jgi:hypothetical protein